MSHIDGTRKSYSSPYEITVCMTKEECKILLPFFQKAYKSVNQNTKSIMIFTMEGRLRKEKKIFL